MPDASPLGAAAPDASPPSLESERRGTPSASDAEQFEALLAPILDAAYTYAVRLTRNPTDAEDLVQEAALRALRGFGGFERGTNFKAWYFRILTNCFLTNARGSGRRLVSIEQDDSPDILLYRSSQRAGILRPGDDPVARVVTAMSTDEIMAAFDELPADYRAVALLHLVEELPYEEIARVLGCPIGTVRSRLHRARKLLQKALWRLAQEHGIVDTLKSPESRDAS